MIFDTSSIPLQCSTKWWACLIASMHLNAVHASERLFLYQRLAISHGSFLDTPLVIQECLPPTFLKVVSFDLSNFSVSYD